MTNMQYNHKFRLAAAVLSLMFIAACAHVENAPEPVVKPLVKSYDPYKSEAGKIHWMRWGDEAFKAAKSADKLILLDVSASWCHWCIVMDETTYSDPRVVKLVNSEFVPVYVDTDERPDINDRYNQGGWPSISVLTPDGRVITGKTTMTADELVEMLEKADSSYKKDRDAVYARIDSLQSSVEESKEELEKEKKPQSVSALMALRVLRAVNLFVDPVHGGYGGPDKFPLPGVMDFALYLYPKISKFKGESPEKAIRLTLDGMASGLLDKVEGGFFRYSTSVDWKSPHYEKLASTNGELLGVYMLAYQRLGDRKYLEVGDSVANYLLKALYDDENGAFYSSQAADEQYYRLDYDQRLARGAPPVDGSIYADVNAHVAMGFLDAYRATGNERRMAVGLRTVEYIVANLYDAGKGVRHSKDSAGGYYLSDQVYSALAALEAYQATGNHRYLEFAMDVAEFMAGKFWDADKGGFFDSYYPDNTVGLLSTRNKPQSENSNAAILLMELYHITGDNVYRETAMRTLEPFTADYAKYTFWASEFGLAVEHCVEASYQFTIVGSIYQKGTMDLVTRSFTYDDPDRVVVVLDPERDKDRIARLGYKYDGVPVLYVCSDNACYPPVHPGESLDKVREYIEKSKGR
jgi:uncharacterized protein